MPSSVSVTSAPMAVRLRTITSIRLDSLTFSSAASLITVSPSAKQAMAAIIGSSSMSVGMMAPPMTVPCKAEERTRMSAVGSPSPVDALTMVKSAPMSLQTRKIPSLVGLIPTCRIRISELGIIRPAQRKKAAEEISPGTWILLANSSFAG